MAGWNALFDQAREAFSQDKLPIKQSNNAFFFRCPISAHSQVRVNRVLPRVPRTRRGE